MAERSSRRPGAAGIRRAQGKIAPDEAAVLEKIFGLPTSLEIRLTGLEQVRLAFSRRQGDVRAR
jgi:hypothetical protein